MTVRTITAHRRFEIAGEMYVPGDKSIAHRAMILGALARGRTLIKGAPLSADVNSTYSALKALGVPLERSGTSISVDGTGKGRLPARDAVVDCGGSATTMRLLLGAVAARGQRTTLVGDQYLSVRPMRRVMAPLSTMGALFEAREGDFAPVVVTPPERLSAGKFFMEVASAQVKTALLIAALFADGRSEIRGALGSRDHAERMIPRMGGRVVVTKEAIVVEPGLLDGIAISVPGDPSTAAFFAAAAALGKNSSLTIRDMSTNPTRMGFFEALSWMGADVAQQDAAGDSFEPHGDVTVRWSPLRPIEIHSEAVPFLVDEVPLVILLATQAEGRTALHGVGELRLKETDRIRCAVAGLRAMGASILVDGDSVFVDGPTPLSGATLDPCGDHRMSMMFTLAAHIAQGTSTIIDVDCESKSCPEFYPMLQKVLSR